MHITKMHGLGNDFIISMPFKGSYEEAARALCARRVSVGADGLIIVEPSEIADIKMRIFNADGSEAEMCGNGIRCFARFVYDRGIVKTPDMSVETLAGVMHPQVILENGAAFGVKVNMGQGMYTGCDVPVYVEDAQNFRVEGEGYGFDAASMRMGVPHTVLFLDDLNSVDVDWHGSRIESHHLFPERTNVNFAAVDGDKIYMRTYERGAGKTMACGTGATAAALLAYRKGLAPDKVEVILEAGSLFIEIDDDLTAYMTGPADYVLEGDTFWNSK